MNDLKLANVLLLFWSGSFSYEPRPDYSYLMGFVLLSLYLSQFLSHSTDFAHLEEFYYAFWFLSSKLENSKIRFL